ncbi:hypothetical protein PEPS_45730 (plasmid) [Persicobacter psychrovividus]|uniref:Uncharacterized protein n=1 Tax=Persicobacter psychrovividus TaxID=387638 RepID=A0ABM7VMT0_9BACT|nr:hypothetical protein PEPS_45730 [Persicobacter psychrovividus]
MQIQEVKISAKKNGSDQANYEQKIWLYIARFQGLRQIVFT